MSDQYRGQRQGSQSPSSDGYTPAPVKKTRAVTGSHLKVSDPGPGQPHEAASMESVSPSRDSRPSIQINLNTINEATQNVVDQELEEQAKLAEFAPLSSTPLTYQSTIPDDFSGQWSSVTPIPDMLTPPPEGSYNAHGAPDLYRGRRRSLMILAVLTVISGWFIGMATQIGVSRLLTDPYGETMSIISGASQRDKELDQLREPGVQTTINVNEGTAIARVLSVEPLGKGAFAIQGVVLNESSQALDTVLLTLILKSPERVSVPWVERHEFACCTSQDLEGLTKSEIGELVKKSAEGAPLDARVNLDEGRSAQFTYITQLKGRKARLKRGEVPQAKIEVSFFE